MYTRTWAAALPRLSRLLGAGRLGPCVAAAAFPRRAPPSPPAGAYILGTLTLLVVKADERTGRYRDLSSNLRAYSALNNLPQELKDTMQEHLRLSFSNSEASDDQVGGSSAPGAPCADGKHRRIAHRQPPPRSITERPFVRGCDRRLASWH